MVLNSTQLKYRESLLSQVHTELYKFISVSLQSSTCSPETKLLSLKPLVEKLRRERINSSIEQLKSLLGPEFLKQQPDSKLEKADILEMTVCFLTRLQQQQQHPAVDSAAVDQGYSRCVQVVVHFLSKDQVKTQSQRRLLNHFNKNLREADFCPLSSTVQTSMEKEQSPVCSAPWRPW
uniref:BHLH domain-containing protein n=1 Tax=Kryptolebias marmoratus TaxID=37003 RepID=A0A3Q3A231_KRYMA